MRTVFFGTPDVALPGLRALFDSNHAVIAVVTQPDKPRGRHGTPSPSPVKELAIERGIPILQPGTPKHDGFADDLRALEPDVLAVIAYGHILPRAVLDVARAVNVHFSLLPRYRGAAPVQRALMDGVTQTGVSVFTLEPTVDTGPVLLTARLEVGPEETSGELLERLAPLGADLLVRALDGLQAGTLAAQIQDPSEASPAPKIKPEETVIDWTRPAAQIANLVRALNPRPAASTTYRGKRLLLLRARAASGAGTPGVVLRADRDGLVVATADGELELLQVQPEGKRPITGQEFVRGYHPAQGDVLGEMPG